MTVSSFPEIPAKAGLCTQNLDGRGVLCSRASPESTTQGGEV